MGSARSVLLSHASSSRTWIVSNELTKNWEGSWWDCTWQPPLKFRICRIWTCHDQSTFILYCKWICSDSGKHWARAWWNSNRLPPPLSPKLYPHSSTCLADQTLGPRYSFWKKLFLQGCRFLLLIVIHSFLLLFDGLQLVINTVHQPDIELMTILVPFPLEDGRLLLHKFHQLRRRDWVHSFFLPQTLQEFLQVANNTIIRPCVKDLSKDGMMEEHLQDRIGIAESQGFLG